MITRTRTLPRRVTAIACDRGASAIEFALAAPVFLLLVLGTLAYGIYFSAAHSVAQIAADAARTAVAGIDDGERQTLVGQYIKANGSAYSFVDPSKLTVTAYTNGTDKNQYIVKVSYDARGLPVWNLFPRLVMPPAVIVRSTAIRVGGL